MANTFSAFGFRSFGDLDGAAPTMGLQRFYIASSDTNSYFTGDAVAVSSQSLIAGYLTLPASGSVPGGAGIAGIFAGCEYYSPSLNKVVWSSYFPASVGSSSPCNGYVITDPNQLFIVQCTTTAVIGTSCIGLNIGFASSLQASGNTTTGISAVALNSSTVSATNTLPFRIVDSTSNYFPPGTNGADGTTAGAIMVVAFNNQSRKSLTGLST